MTNSPSSRISIAKTVNAVNSELAYPRHKAYLIDRRPTYSEQLKFIISQVQRYMYLPEPRPLIITLATVIANRMPGPPVWTMLVGPPSSGKSEFLNMIVDIEGLIEVSSLTEAGLLSASEKWANGATGGLLRQIGTLGTIVAKDFTTIMNMNPRDRDKILAILRELYDGRWVRHVGSSGGKQVTWQGKLGFVGGVTEVIDSKRHLISSLGDRFIYLRMDAQSAKSVVASVLGRNGSSESSRLELRGYVNQFIKELEIPEHSAEINKEDQAWIEISANVAATGRSTVDRDYTQRNITEVPMPESPGRLAASLGQLYSALIVIGCSHNEARGLIRDIAIGCIPASRSRLLLMISGSENGLTVEQMRQGEKIIYPYTIVQRTLTEMECLMMVRKDSQGPYKTSTNLWQLHPAFKAMFRSL